MWLPAIVSETYEMGRMASSLIPDWVESNHETLGDYMCAHGMSAQMADKIATMGLTYYEVPSLEIWRQLGYWDVARAAQLCQEGCIRRLIEQGANPLDTIAMLLS